MVTNKNYGKLKTDGTIEYAPRKFFEDGKLIVPRLIDDVFFFARGWYKVIDEKPSYDSSTSYCQFEKWTANEETKSLIAEYSIKEIPAPIETRVKRYSKLKITLFCIEQGIWEQVKEYLTKIGFYDLFVMAQFFLETDEYFVKGLEMYAEAAVDANTSKEDIEALIETMKNFAHDGYVTLDDEGNIIGY